MRMQHYNASEFEPSKQTKRLTSFLISAEETGTNTVVILNKDTYVYMCMYICLNMNMSLLFKLRGGDGHPELEVPEGRISLAGATLKTPCTPAFLWKLPCFAIGLLYLATCSEWFGAESWEKLDFDTTDYCPTEFGKARLGAEPSLYFRGTWLPVVLSKCMLNAQIFQSALDPGPTVLLLEAQISRYLLRPISLTGRPPLMTGGIIVLCQAMSTVSCFLGLACSGAQGVVRSLVH